jgi:hypothetical protein
MLTEAAPLSKGRWKPLVCLQVTEQLTVGSNFVYDDACKTMKGCRKRPAVT